MDVHELTQFSSVLQFLDYIGAFDQKEHRYEGDIHCADDCLDRRNLVFHNFLLSTASCDQFQDSEPRETILGPSVLLT